MKYKSAEEALQAISEESSQVWNTFCVYCRQAGELVSTGHSERMSQAQLIQMCQELGIAAPMGPLAHHVIHVIHSNYKQLGSNSLTFPDFKLAMEALARGAHWTHEEMLDAFEDLAEKNADQQPDARVLQSASRLALPTEAVMHEASSVAPTPNLTGHHHLNNSPPETTTPPPSREHKKRFVGIYSNKPHTMAGHSRGAPSGNPQEAMLTGKPPIPSRSQTAGFSPPLSRFPNLSAANPDVGAHYLFTPPMSAPAVSGTRASSRGRSGSSPPRTRGDFQAPSAGRAWGHHGMHTGSVEVMVEKPLTMSDSWLPAWASQLISRVGYLEEQNGPGGKRLDSNAILTARLEERLRAVEEHGAEATRRAEQLVQELRRQREVQGDLEGQLAVQAEALRAGRHAPAAAAGQQAVADLQADQVMALEGKPEPPRHSTDAGAGAKAAKEQSLRLQATQEAAAEALASAATAAEVAAQSASAAAKASDEVRSLASRLESLESYVRDLEASMVVPAPTPATLSVPSDMTDRLISAEAAAAEAQHEVRQLQSRMSMALNVAMMANEAATRATKAIDKEMAPATAAAGASNFPAPNTNSPESPWRGSHGTAFAVPEEWSDRVAAAEAAAVSAHVQVESLCWRMDAAEAAAAAVASDSESGALQASLALQVQELVQAIEVLEQKLAAAEASSRADIAESVAGGQPQQPPLDPSSQALSVDLRHLAVRMSAMENANRDKEVGTSANGQALPASTQSAVVRGSTLPRQPSKKHDPTLPDGASKGDPASFFLSVTVAFAAAAAAASANAERSMLASFQASLVGQQVSGEPPLTPPPPLQQQQLTMPSPGSAPDNAPSMVAVLQQQQEQQRLAVADLSAKLQLVSAEVQQQQSLDVQGAGISSAGSVRSEDLAATPRIGGGIATVGSLVPSREEQLQHLQELISKVQALDSNHYVMPQELASFENRLQEQWVGRGHAGAEDVGQQGRSQQQGLAQVPGVLPEDLAGLEVRLLQRLEGLEQAGNQPGTLLKLSQLQQQLQQLSQAQGQQQQQQSSQAQQQQEQLSLVQQEQQQQLVLMEEEQQQLLMQVQQQQLQLSQAQQQQEQWKLVQQEQQQQLILMEEEQQQLLMQVQQQQQDILNAPHASGPGVQPGAGQGALEQQLQTLEAKVLSLELQASQARAETSTAAQQALTGQLPDALGSSDSATAISELSSRLDSLWDANAELSKLVSSLQSSGAAAAPPPPPGVSEEMRKAVEFLKANMESMNQACSRVASRVESKVSSSDGSQEGERFGRAADDGRKHSKYNEMQERLMYIEDDLAALQPAASLPPKVDELSKGLMIFAERLNGRVDKIEKQLKQFGEMQLQYGGKAEERLSFIGTPLQMDAPAAPQVLEQKIDALFQLIQGGEGADSPEDGQDRGMQGNGSYDGRSPEEEMYDENAYAERKPQRSKSAIRRLGYGVQTEDEVPEMAMSSRVVRHMMSAGDDDGGSEYSYDGSPTAERNFAAAPAARRVSIVTPHSAPGAAGAASIRSNLGLPMNLERKTATFQPTSVDLGSTPRNPGKSKLTFSGAARNLQTQASIVSSTLMGRSHAAPKRAANPYDMRKLQANVVVKETDTAPPLSPLPASLAGQASMRKARTSEGGSGLLRGQGSPSARSASISGTAGGPRPNLMTSMSFSKGSNGGASPAPYGVGSPTPHGSALPAPYGGGASRMSYSGMPK